MRKAEIQTLPIGTKLYRVAIALVATPQHRIRAEVVESEVVVSAYNRTEKAVVPSNAATTFADLYHTRAEAEMVLESRLASIRASLANPEGQ